jgi:hypothetical protein
MLHENQFTRPLPVISVAPRIQQTISGTVQEADTRPLAFANVLLLNSRDSSLVKGAASDEKGHYTLENIRPGHYLLAATMVGYGRVYGSLCRHSRPVRPHGTRPDPAARHEATP